MGTIWLLGSLGLIGATGLVLLWRLWPLVLILIRLDLLVGRHAPVLGAGLGLVAVAAVVLVLLAAPQGPQGQAGPFVPPLGSALQPRTRLLAQPLADAREARIDLDLSRWATTVSSLDGHQDLLEAHIDYTGELSFRSEGPSTSPALRLSQRDTVRWPFWTPGPTQGRWGIGLSPDVPLHLGLDAGSGPLEADLSALTLRSLVLVGGSGPTVAKLPSGSYSLDADVGSGRVEIAVAEGANVQCRLEGGSGALDLELGKGLRLSPPWTPGRAPPCCAFATGRTRRCV